MSLEFQKTNEYKNSIDNNCVKQAIEYNGEQNLDENTSYFQWRQQSDHVFESNKYNNISDSVSTTYPVNVRDLPQISQEKMLSWYCTVPLRHDPHDYHTTPTIQEIQLNRKERLLSERQKRFRTSFTTCQLERLEQEFQKDKYAVGMKRMHLASELGLTEKQIKVWYQNRRMKYKRVCQRIHNKRMATVNTYW
ncbi:ventral anterior homeobox 2a-like isoform X2 [Xenia sp. Carnegie-2017]|nr:ventral anterior homeobox 2a-like isoform X2 [Xenia sp. Carnegie-2017]